VGAGQTGWRAPRRRSPALGADLLVGARRKLRRRGPPEGVRKLRRPARYSGRGLALLAAGDGVPQPLDSNDQVPSRVESGPSRAGQIDSTDGGRSSASAVGSWRRGGGTAADEVQLFGIHSDLDLYSNFTYFLDDPVRGDQFNQKDRRVIVGGSATRSRQLRVLGAAHLLRGGVQARADFIGGLELHRTEARARHGTIRDDRARQTGTGVFVEAESRWRPWFRSVIGVRAMDTPFASRATGRRIPDGARLGS
jgi:hypothetical protein